MDKKTIEPLNNNIEIEENKSFASRENQRKASDVYQENTQKEALAIETRNLLRQRLKHDIRQEISKMRKHVLWLSFFLFLCFLCIIHKKIILHLFGFSLLPYKSLTIISGNHV